MHAHKPPMVTKFARFISIAGHPALLMPAAALASAASEESRVQVITVVIAVLFSALIFVYGFVKTKCGEWKHIDASNKNERKELNLTAGISLLICTAILALLEIHLGIVVAAGLSGAIVLASHVFSRIAKPSLHVSFAVFAAFLTFPDGAVFGLLLVFAVVIGWSRLYLARHSWRDLAIGAFIGFAAGACFHFIIL